MLLEVLRGAGVDTRWIARVPEATGHAIIQRDPAGQNCILLFSGANQTITPEQARGVLGQFAPGDWLMLQNEISAVEQLMELAHSMGIRIAFNPSPMTEAVRTYPLHLADLLIFNEIEAAGICGVEACAGEQLLSLLGQRFPQSQVVLTLGGAGRVVPLRRDHGFSAGLFRSGDGYNRRWRHVYRVSSGRPHSKAFAGGSHAGRRQRRLPWR